MTARILILLLSLFGCGIQPTQQAEAQQISTGGLPFVYTNSPGILTGRGTINEPLTATLYTDGTTMTGSGSAGSPVGSITVTHPGVFGAGTDGACNFDGSATVLGFAPVANVYSPDRDIYCTTIVVATGVTVFGPYRYTASTSIALTGTGKFSCDGKPGTGAVAGIAIAAGSLPGGGAGGAGNTGAGTAGTNGAAAHQTDFPSGAAGAGGAGVSGGGNGGTTGAAFTANNSDAQTVWTSVAGRTLNSVAAGTPLGGGGGGGGGNGTQKGGGGGGGACYIAVAAPVITGSGSVTALGAVGGNAENGATATGGGGGGHGGIVVIVKSRGSFPTSSVLGSLGGTHGSGGGSDGATGANGLVQPYTVGEL